MPIAPLPGQHLRWRVPEGLFTFTTTEDITPTDAFVGQANALLALRRGVEMQSPGFNVFVAGLPSTGRLGAVERIVRGFTPHRRGARDLAYVRNFVDPARPRLLSLPPGRAVPFRRELMRVALTLIEEIPRLLAQGEVRRKRDAETHDAAATSHAALQRLRAHAREKGFVVGDVGEGEDVEPVIFWVEPSTDGTERDEAEAPVHTRAELQVLAGAGEVALPRPLSDVLADFDALAQELAEAQEASRRALLDTVRVVGEVEAEAVRIGTAPIFAQLSKSWPRARAWLTELHDALVESPEWFDGDGDHAELIASFTANVVHVGARSRAAPVVLAANPTWQNLYGGIEGAEAAPADHRAIRAGALADADGGFLVLNANELIQEPATWKVLKRALMYGETDIQNPGDAASGAPVLRPDPLRLDVKVILVGDSDTYAALYYGDPDFGKLFKIKAEFEPDAPITSDLLHGFSSFVARVVRRERLQPLDQDALCAVLEWAVREAGRGGRISTHFGGVADLVRESSFEAVALGAPVVTRDHVERARTSRRRRDDYAERRVLEMVEADVLRVDVSGTRVGQANALVVYHVGGHDFGRPVRLTAAVGAGRRGLVSIERVARLSGRSHDKGVSIVQGLLLDRFGREGRLTFSAMLGFEQSYTKVDGDSATMAETLVMMSALARLPMRQDLALTGSLDQFGEVQAVGGVNEKIEGFWKACHLRGATGTQGVVIPHGNVADLCLSEEVQADCVDGRFHVWAVRTLEDAIELVFGRPAGRREADGAWTPGSVHAAVSAGIAELRRLVRGTR
jgi:ATP-dependent Lon protease